MSPQGTGQTAHEGIAFRAVSSVLLLAATALLVGSLISAPSANTSPNSGRLAVKSTI